MMSRSCLVALLGVALMCGLVAGQNQGTTDTDAAPSDDVAPASPKQMPKNATATEPAPEPTAEPEPEPEPEANPEPEPGTEAEGETNAKSEASFSSEENNGAALVSVSLPSLVLAAVLAKVFAH